MSQQEALTAGVEDSATTSSEVLPPAATTEAAGLLPPPAASTTEAAELMPPPTPTESAGIEPAPSLGDAEVSDEPALPENWGRFGHLTPEQQSASEAFLSKHESALELNKYPSESSVNVALRFLRARKFDIELAGDLLFECNKRKREGGAFVCKELSPAECAKCDVVAMKNFYPHTMAGFDKQGRPILWEISGSLNVTALLVMMSRETLINYHWWTMETKVRGLCLCVCVCVIRYALTLAQQQPLLSIPDPTLPARTTIRGCGSTQAIAATQRHICCPRFHRLRPVAPLPRLPQPAKVLHQYGQRLLPRDTGQAACDQRAVDRG
jgi:hypothetical protein